MSVYALLHNSKVATLYPWPWCKSRLSSQNQRKEQRGFGIDDYWSRRRSFEALWLTLLILLSKLFLSCVLLPSNHTYFPKSRLRASSYVHSMYNLRCGEKASKAICLLIRIHVYDDVVSPLPPKRYTCAGLVKFKQPLYERK